MRLLKIAIPCAVLLSGYASLATQASSDAATPGIRPGQWEFATEMTSVEMPGASEDLLRQLRATVVGQRQVHSQCITPEQARNPPGALLGGQNPAGCEFGESIWAGGIIRLRATCRPSDNLSDSSMESPPQSLPVQISIEGTYAPQQIDNRMNVAVEMPNPSGEGAPTQLRLQGRMTGRRTGDCTTAQPEPGPEGNSAAAPVN